MRPFRPFGLLVLLLSLPAFAAGPLPQPEFAIAPQLSPNDPMPERQTQWSNPAVALTDVVYRVIPGYRPLHLDLYRAGLDSPPRPLIVFVHGGGWSQANPRAGAAYKNFPEVLAYLAQRGYVVAAIEYRFALEAPFPAPLDDLRVALQFLRENASRFGIDGTRVGLWGMSSGAQLAALVAVDCAQETCVRAFAGWFGPYDLRPPFPQPSVVRDFLACGDRACEADVLGAASPLLHVDAEASPTLLVHGDLDKNVPPEQSKRFAAALAAAGVRTELKLVPGVGHGLIGPDEAATREALGAGLAATINFFDRELHSRPAARDTEGR